MMLMLLLFQSDFGSLNPAVEIGAVDQPGRVTVLRKPDDRDFAALAECAEGCGTDAQVLAGWSQAQEPSRRVVPLRHCTRPTFSFQRCAVFVDRATFSARSSSLSTVNSHPGPSSPAWISSLGLKNHSAFPRPRTRSPAAVRMSSVLTDKTDKKTFGSFGSDESRPFCVRSVFPLQMT